MLGTLTHPEILHSLTHLAYADAMALNPVLKFIEVYLLLAFVVHAVAGGLLSWRKRAFIAKVLRAHPILNTSVAAR